MPASLIALLFLAVSPVADQAEPAFAIHLPTVKVDHNGAEYWAEIEGPAGQRLWSYAIYEGGDRWTVPLRAPDAGQYKLLRIEKRQGEKRENVSLREDSQTQLRLGAEQTRAAASTERKTLVEAGEFKTIFAAEEPWCLNDHTLVQDPQHVWHMLAITHEKPFNYAKDPATRLAHATAKTLLQAPWDAHPPAIVADWDRYREFLLWAPHVVKHDGLFYMFVCVGDKDTEIDYRIHLLTSPDLKTWTRHPHNPIVIDGFAARDPMVLRVGDKWVMYYTANSHPHGGNHIVATLTSRDLVHWADRRVAFVHPQARNFGGPTESPFVVRRGDAYYLFACDDQWINIFVSRDPYRWHFDDQVGRIFAHASEVVRDTDGQWFISHVGWHRGPLKIAPLLWKDGLDDAPASIVPAAK
jgi:beta-fructofuranosidase